MLYLFSCFFLKSKIQETGLEKECSSIIIEKGCFLFIIATLLHFYDYYFYLLHSPKIPPLKQPGVSVFVCV